MIDNVITTFIAGKGGDGIVSFRREKYVPKGGPDGGDGGKGGNIILECSSRVSTLKRFARLKQIEAPNGISGQRKKRHGSDGEDLVIKVPVGTQIFEIKQDNKTSIADLKKDGQSFMIAKGGKGGLGNSHFATPTNQTPRIAQKGRLGERREVLLSLKLIADVGLIGLPNVGKSTLLKMISNANPKIANYAFTTLEPNLGVVNYKGKSFVVADIPGLIEGSSKGKGLGDKFLQHVQRTKILVHLISHDSDDLDRDYNIVKNELSNFLPSLNNKVEIIVISKTDLTKQDQNINKFTKKHPVIKISYTNNKSIQDLLNKIIETL